MHLTFEQPSLIVLAGPSGSGKSEFAHRLFADAAVLSLSEYRRLISDDAHDRSVNREASEQMRNMARARLASGRTAVVDAPNLLRNERKALVHLATTLKLPCHLIVMDCDIERCEARLRSGGRPAPDPVLQRDAGLLDDLLTGLQRERHQFSSVTVLDPDGADGIEEVRLVRKLSAGLDIIGDVHGCATELRALLTELGYRCNERGVHRHPQGRLAVFLGDLCDRGPASLEVLGLVDLMVQGESALIGAIGNHDFKAYRHLVLGRDVMIPGSTSKEVEEAAAADPGTPARIKALLSRLFEDAAPANSVLGDDRLLVTHGALLPNMAGARTSPSRRDPISTFCMFGQDSGEREEDGRPIRTLAWTEAWRDNPRTVCFGHEVVGALPARFGDGNVLGLDTGCVYGGRLSALRFPENEIVGVGAARVYDADPDEALSLPSAPVAAPLEVVRMSVDDLPDGRSGLRLAADAS